MKYIIVVAGPCGCGKSSVCDSLAKLLKAPDTEGDEIHPAANVEKMSKGIPLTDEDRWGWLESIAKVSYEKLQSPENESQKYSLISCSSLKKIYRDYVEQQVAKLSKDVKVVWVFLAISFEESVKRVTARKNHYMKPNMVKSQFDILELPQGDELLVDDDAHVNAGGRVVSVVPDNKPHEAIMAEILQKLGQCGVVQQ